MLSILILFFTFNSFSFCVSISFHFKQVFVYITTYCIRWCIYNIISRTVEHTYIYNLAYYLSNYMEITKLHAMVFSGWRYDLRKQKNPTNSSWIASTRHFGRNWSRILLIFKEGHQYEYMSCVSLYQTIIKNNTIDGDFRRNGTHGPHDYAAARGLQPMASQTQSPWSSQVCTTKKTV
jgi:hypothetical protein